ncbi:50S ribosomal protein L37ae [archaeon]|jgi:large subunit ribosomal protein L37Ae|nr:50S ribosomal protein L37ae [archaeon]MBT3731219.1 50S ribosomal protein L37ae [archaeon]MBT4670027.1 50S ribosomal protein L37ae [archaeon]MBT5287771.1 50S ribosomal protein L37ae [archaeon]MBT7052776.1 50S ribosomal protein L37ae [archaeon]
MAKKIGSAGRFGARYGRKLRSKIINVEKIQRKKQKCPYCSRLAAKRLAMGIFECKKCSAKFTGKAYIVGE